jgi:hypothetical protein
MQLSVSLGRVLSLTLDNVARFIFHDV